jgi:hypothetical protein
LRDHTKEKILSGNILRRKKKPMRNQAGRLKVVKLQFGLKIILGRLGITKTETATTVLVMLIEKTCLEMIRNGSTAAWTVINTMYQRALKSLVAKEYA